MDNEERDDLAVQEEEAKWIIDVDTDPLVNISTFGWTEGEPHSILLTLYFLCDLL